MSNGGNELALQEARWAREDKLKAQEKKEKRKDRRRQEKATANAKKEAKLKQEELQRQSEEKEKQAKLKFRQFTQGVKDKRAQAEGKAAQAKDQALKEKQEKAQAVTFKSAYSETAPKYFGSILLLLLNLLAVSISLNCNKDSNLIIKIGLAILAFFLSLPYLIIHFVRIVIFKKERCLFNNVEFFI